jgi:hypothetical protein
MQRTHAIWATAQQQRMQRRAMWVLGSLVLALVISGGVNPISAAEQRLNICHLTGQGVFQLITVDASALLGHFDHGDGVPGGAVPDQPGFTFDDTCAEVPVPPPVCQANRIETTLPDPPSLGACRRFCLANFDRTLCAQQGGTARLSELESFCECFCDCGPQP